MATAQDILSKYKVNTKDPRNPDAQAVLDKYEILDEEIKGDTIQLTPWQKDQVEKAKGFEESKPGKALSGVEKVLSMPADIIGLSSGKIDSKSLEELYKRKQRRIKHGLPKEKIFGETFRKETKEGLIGVAKAAPYLIPAGKVVKGVSKLAKVGRAVLPAIEAGAVVGGATGAEELLKGTAPKEAGKEALKAGKTTAIITGGFGVGGKGIAKLGKKILKGSLDPQFSEKVVKATLDDIGLTKKSQKTFADVAKKASRRTKAIKKVFGKAVGESKVKAAAESITVDTQFVKRKAAEMIRKSKIGTPKGVKAVDSGRMKVLKDVMKQLDQNKMSAEDALTTLTNMDNALANTYTRGQTGATITTAEKIAKQIRGIMKGETDKMLGKTFQGSKQNYIKIMNILDANNKQIAKGMASPDKAQALLKKAFKEGNTDLLKNLEQLDRLLPKNKTFIRDAMNKALSEEISRSARIRPGWRIEGLMDLLAPIAATGLRKAPQLKAIGQLVGRKAGQVANE